MNCSLRACVARSPDREARFPLAFEVRGARPFRAAGDRPAVPAHLGQERAVGSASHRDVVDARAAFISSLDGGCDELVASERGSEILDQAGASDRLMLVGIARHRERYVGDRK